MWTPRIDPQEWPTRDDLFFAQLLAEHVGELNAVLRHPRDRDGLRRHVRVPSKRSAGAALIPLDHGEVPQPQPEPGVAPEVGRVARSAVKKEQHGVVSVFAANRDPLLDAADFDVPGLVDAVRRGDGVVARVPRAQERPCRFELLGVGAGRRILPRGRGGDANEKQERPKSGGCPSHDSPARTSRDIMAVAPNEDQRASCHVLRTRTFRGTGSISGSRLPRHGVRCASKLVQAEQPA